MFVRFPWLLRGITFVDFYLTYEMHKFKHWTDRDTHMIITFSFIARIIKTYVFSSDHHMSVIHLYIYMSFLKYDKRILNIVLMKSLHTLHFKIYLYTTLICFLLQSLYRPFNEGWYQYFYLPRMVFGTSWFLRVLYKIFMKIVQILIKSTTCNSEVLVDFKNIESPDYI